jgi:hypothetical protein
MKTSPQALATEELVIAARQRAVHAFFFTKEFLAKKQHDCQSPTTLLFSVSPMEDKTERPSF